MYSTYYAKQDWEKKEFGVGGVLYFSFLFSEIFFIKGQFFYGKSNLEIRTVYSVVYIEN